MLYRGWFFLTRVDSRIRASTSLSVTMYSRSADFGNQVLRFGIQRPALLKIGAHALAQRAGLAYIDDFPLGIFIDIDAGLSRQMIDLLLQHKLKIAQYDLAMDDMRMLDELTIIVTDLDDLTNA